MRRVLWVTAEPPDHQASGGPIRQAFLLDAVAARADVHLVCTREVTDPSVVQACASVTTAKPSGRSSSARAARLRRYSQWLVGRHPTSVIDHRAVRRALQTHIDRPADVDVVHVEHSELAPLIGEHRVGRWTLDLHNLLSVRARQRAQAATSWQERVYLRSQERRSRSFEERMVAAYDRVFVATREDANQLGSNVGIVPNGVDLDRYRPSRLPARPRVLFVGHFAYPPNVQAVTWFLTAVLPHVRQELPGVEVVIAGRSPDRSFSGLVERSQAVLHADVPEVAPLLSDARVAIVPLLVGSGSRLKALEAMAAGRPVVGTSIGLEGLGVEDSVHALVADDPQAFARATVQVLTDDAVAERLARGGRELAERHDWRGIGRRFADELLDEVAGDEDRTTGGDL